MEQGVKKMKLAVSSYGKDLNAELDPRFGRCAYFLIVDPDDMSFEVFDNESGSLSGGAGIQSAQFVASKGVNAVITGNYGPNAAQTLSAAGIELFLGQSGIIKEVVDRFKKGSLKPTAAANVDSHFGMAGNTSVQDPGPDVFGTGMGMGRGRGLRGGKRKLGLQAVEQKDSEKELSRLKNQVQDLNKKMREIIGRIEEIEE
jgi:predicted Fe-Mo cluster-binding NifX family protein